MKQLQLKVGKYDLVVTTEQHESKQWVALKPLCEAIGLDYTRQYRKVQSNPQFNYCLKATVGGDGKEREMLLIPVNQIGMWICNINANRVKPELKDRLIECQKELQWVLHTALTGEVTPQRVAELESKLEKALNMIEYLGGLVAQLIHEREADRYIERGEASAAGSRLVAQRWANNARSSPHLS